MIAWFKAETPGEVYRLSNAGNLWLAVWDLDQSLRDKIKYSDREELQAARDMLHEALQDYGLDLDLSGNE